MFTPLHELGTASLGYKSLQNNFFYVDKETIDQFGIERRFLVPIRMLKSLDARAYVQKRKRDVWLFSCRLNMEDLRGTGARKYIQSMATRSATQRKQSGRSQTIREALQAQGGGLWYAPKARPRKHHIWFRKALDGVFAPYIFPNAAVVDQRCNGVAPHDGIEWQELGAVMTSSLFAYAVEINGSASMGAGALEASTRKLREYPVFDVRSLSRRERRKLVSLGMAVWNNSSPVDWTKKEAEPSSELRVLDGWLLKRAGGDISHDILYRDFSSVCMARFAVARDKGKKIRKRQSESIGSVADSIVKAVEPKVHGRNFPDDFARGVKLDLIFDFGDEKLQHVAMEPFLDDIRVIVTAQNGHKVYDDYLKMPVAEAMVRALLWGRTKFAVSSNKKNMMSAVKRFVSWLSDIDAEIDQHIEESAFGTGYENRLRAEVYSRLGVRPLASAQDLPGEMFL